MHFGDTLAEQPRRVQIHTYRVCNLLIGYLLDERRERLIRHRYLLVLPGERALEILMKLLQGEGPHVALIWNEALQHPDRARLSASSAVFEPSSDGRGVRERSFLREKASHLEIEVEPRLESPEDFHYKRVAIDD